MIGIDAGLGIAAVALAMVLTPGPNMIYLVSRSITQGRPAGLISLLGVAVGFFVYLLAAVTGFSAVFALVPGMYTAIKIAGGCYLLWLAWNAVKPGGRSAFTPQELPIDKPRKLFTMGLVTNLLNPKIAVLYVSLLPQFVDPDKGGIAVQSLTLGLIQITVALTVNCMIVLTAGSVADFLSRKPAWLKAQRYAMGTVLVALAASMAFDRTEATVPR